jgi:hypothetical protein
VPGVTVIDGSLVAAVGVVVGRDKPGRVGGRVEVTKRGAAAVDGPGAILTQAARRNVASRMQIRFFFICRFYFEIMRRL